MRFSPSNLNEEKIVLEGQGNRVRTKIIRKIHQDRDKDSEELIDDRHDRHE